MFTASTYRQLHRVVFNETDRWTGYRPEVVELPNGDGRADMQKRYAHIKHEHFDQARVGNACAYHAFQSAYVRACDVAIRLGIPSQYWPDRKACALRVLEYPPGVGGERHTDFDLFTLNLYRSDGGACMREEAPVGRDYRDVPKGVHLGELYDLIFPPTVTDPTPCATPHQIAPSVVAQYSIVFFALPSPEAVLPSGLKVGDWLAERYARSRAYK